MTTTESEAGDEGDLMEATESATPINQTDSDTEILFDEQDSKKCQFEINVDLQDPCEYVEKFVSQPDIKMVQSYARKAGIDIRTTGELMLLRDNLHALNQYGHDPNVHQKYVKYLLFTQTRIVYNKSTQNKERQHKKEFNKVSLALLNNEKRNVAAPYNCFRADKISQMDIDKGLAFISFHPGEVCCKMSNKTKSIIFFRYKKLIYIVTIDINSNKVNLIRLTGEYAYYAQGTTYIDKLEDSTDDNLSGGENNRPLQFAQRSGTKKRTSRRAFNATIQQEQHSAFG